MRVLPIVEIQPVRPDVQVMPPPVLIQPEAPTAPCDSVQPPQNMQPLSPGVVPATVTHQGQSPGGAVFPPPMECRVQSTFDQAAAQPDHTCLCQPRPHPTPTCCQVSTQPGPSHLHPVTCSGHAHPCHHFVTPSHYCHHDDSHHTPFRSHQPPSLAQIPATSHQITSHPRPRNLPPQFFTTPPTVHATPPGPPPSAQRPCSPTPTREGPALPVTQVSLDLDSPGDWSLTSAGSGCGTG